MKRRIFILVILTLLSTVSLWAQQTKNKKVETLKKELSISKIFESKIINTPKGKMIEITGVVTYSEEGLPGVTVRFKNIETNVYEGTTTDAFGRYKIIISAGIYDIKFSLIGFQTLEYKKECLGNDCEINVQMQEEPEIY